jgi:hypothetical protein
MREEFESWAISCHMCTYLDGVEYRHKSTEWAWMAWQASRAALVVELPSNCKGMAITVDELRVMMKKIGVTLK